MSDADRGSSPSLPGPGATLAGRFRLRRKLAAGGMGAVYEADDDESGRPVALKVLHPELSSDREIHRRFRREASILAALDHPAVVRVLDIGTDDEGRSYTAMELLQGETMLSRIEREPVLTAADLLPIVEDVCAGLQAAHDHGVIHGDVKPANIFLLAGGREAGGSCVKLVDFGLSKVHGLERLTRTGEVIGTPVYMAPELLTGEGEIDLRVDIYAVGIVLYESFVGRTPFTERNPGRLLFKIVAGEGDTLRELRSDVSEHVATVIQRAMAPKRADRFTSVKELAEAFAEAVRESGG